MPVAVDVGDRVRFGDRNQLAHSTPPPRPGRMPRPELRRAPGASQGPFQRDPTSPPVAIRDRRGRR